MICQTVTVQGANADYEVRISILKLPWGSQFPEKLLSDVASAANVIIEPLGYKFISATFSWADETHGTASLWYDETGTPAIPVSTVILAIIGILVAAGFFILAISIFKWTGANSVLEESKAHTYEEAADILKKKYEAGEITYDQYIAGLKALSENIKGTDWGMIALGVAGILGIAYIFGGKK